MCIKHAEFRRTLTDSEFQNVGALIVDEAHCIVQWGGEFRTAYSEIGKLDKTGEYGADLLGSLGVVSRPSGRR